MKEIYHNLKNYMLTALLVLSSSACGSHGNEQSGTDNSDTPAPSKTSFTQGADISWVSEMEKKGLKFYNHEGIETDCFQLMKELGINAIRLRVWVNPKDRWNSKQDVVNKARRAKEQGLDVMVDFHYSDSWADPGQQFKPKAWIGKSVAELKTAIAAHTIDILQALKAEDISPRWVQVGNEIRPGMLWDENVALSGAFYDIRECDVKGLNSTNERVKYPQNTQNLAEFVNTGYDAVKKSSPKYRYCSHRQCLGRLNLVVQAVQRSWRKIGYDWPVTLSTNSFHKIMARNELVSIKTHQPTSKDFPSKSHDNRNRGKTK